MNERGPKESRKDVSLFRSRKKWNVPLLYRTKTKKRKASRSNSLIHVPFFNFFFVFDFIRRYFTSFPNFSMNGLIRSIGTGNIIVEFFSVAISVRV